MTNQFVFYWMNKNMNLENYTHDELQTIIKNQIPLILNNMDDPNIQKHWKDYCTLSKKTEYEQNIFWEVNC